MKPLIGLLLCSALLIGENRTFNINDTTQATITLKNGAFFVTVGNTEQSLGKIDKAQLRMHQKLGVGALYEIKDFNFDGNADIALSSGSIGYGGVNDYKNYYFYNPRTHRFELAGKEINRLQIEGKELLSYTKDGPFTYQERYGIAAGKLYKKSETLDVGFLTRTVRFNPEGKVRKTDFTPDTLTITAPKAYFYTQPNEGSKTKGYVIKGDKVKVLDYKPFEGWLFIAYKSSKKLFKRWIRQEDVE